MKAKHFLCVFVTVSLLIPALWAVVHAGDETDQSSPEPSGVFGNRTTLRGLQGLYVIVEELGPAVEQLGLTGVAIKTDAELQLRQYGIKVLSREEWWTVPGMPCLYVNVSVLGADEDKQYLLAVHEEVQFWQDVSLDRDPTIRCKAITWSTGSISTVGRANLRTVRDSIKDRVATFINQYLAMNPKQSGPTQDGRGSEVKQK